MMRTRQEKAFCMLTVLEVSDDNEQVFLKEHQINLVSGEGHLRGADSGFKFISKEAKLFGDNTLAGFPVSLCFIVCSPGIGIKMNTVDPSFFDGGIENVTVGNVIDVILNVRVPCYVICDYFGEMLHRAGFRVN